MARLTLRLPNSLHEEIVLTPMIGPLGYLCYLMHNTSHYTSASVRAKKTRNFFYRKYDTNATVMYKRGKVTLWKTNASIVNSVLKKSSGKNNTKFRNKNNSSASFSPVFKDSSGRMRALPGNIIVYFRKAWPENRIISLVERKSLVLIKMLSAYSNSWLIKTKAGMSVLSLVADLQNEDGVKYALPNWWVQFEKK